MTTNKTTSVFQELAPKAIILLSILLVGSAVQLYRNGFGDGRLVFLVLSVLSILVLAMEIRQIKGLLKQPKTSVGQVLEQAANCIPYLFGIYLFFVEGFWRFNQLLDGFSYSIIALGVFFIVCGNYVVSAGYQGTLLFNSDSGLEQPVR